MASLTKGEIDAFPELKRDSIELRRSTRAAFLVLAGAILAGLAQLASPNMNEIARWFAVSSAATSMASVLLGAGGVWLEYFPVALHVNRVMDIESLTPERNQALKAQASRLGRRRRPFLRLQVLAWLFSALCYGVVLVSVLL